MESIQGDLWGTSSLSGLRSRSRTQHHCSSGRRRCARTWFLVQHQFQDRVRATGRGGDSQARTDVLEDVDADIIGHEEWVRDQRVKIDHCVHMFKTKKEDLEQCEKETALLALAPSATSRERREWQKVVDENKALLLHHRQLVQIAKEKLAYLMREVQEKCEQFQFFKRRRRGGDCTPR